MRSCLRMGLIDVLDRVLSQSLKERKLVSKQDEWEVRYAAYVAVDQLQRLSGRSMETVVTYLFFSRNAVPKCLSPIVPFAKLILSVPIVKSYFNPS
jgi:hypothetical protein